MTQRAQPAAAEASVLVLHTLGEVTLRRSGPPGAPAGEEALLGPGKPLALLAYVALAPRRTTTRDHLLDLLWADLDPEKARHALRQTLWYLRQLLGAECLTTTRAGEVTLATPLAVDRDRFLACLEAGALEDAVACYRGSFLDGFAVPGGVEFEHWADVERQRLRAAFLRAAEALTRRYLAAGQAREAQQLARRARDQARGNEALWRLLLEAHAEGGDALGFAMEASALSVMLAGEGREPEPATRALLKRVEDAERSGSAGEAPAVLVAELVGREREFAALVEAWQAVAHGAGRHVHLTAPAGLGKTRLLGDLRERLRVLGARVVSLRANPGEGGIGYTFLAHLATRLAELPGAAAISPASAGALVALSPTLSSRYAAAPDPAAGDEALRRRTAALAELLLVVADERPVALLLDDMHWLDAASRHALRSLLERLDECRALVVTASRHTGPASLAGSATTVLALAALAPLQVLALVGSLGAVPADGAGRRFPDALARATGGSPLLILGTLQLALDRGWLALTDGHWCVADASALERHLEEGSALRHRVAQLEPDARGVLLTLAQAGTPVPATLVAAATGRPPAATADTLLLLEHRGYATRVGDTHQPAHDEIAAASRELAQPDELRDCQAGLGRALASLRHAALADLAQAGRHLNAAGLAAEASGVFTRYLARLRRQGDGRRLADIAREFLGDEATAAEARALVRRLPPWTRLVRSSGRAVALLALLVLILGGFALYASLGVAEPTLALYAVEVDSAGNSELVWAPVDAEGWSTRQPIRMRRMPSGLVPLVLPRGAEFRLEGVALSPDARTTAFARNFSLAADTGTIDLFLATRHGVRRVSFTRRDDGPRDWSPDGRQLLGFTARWSPPGLDDYDLALVDTATGRFTRLTFTTDGDFGGHWSPDGQRIGFKRRWKQLDRPDSFCWVLPAPDQTPTCVDPPPPTYLLEAADWFDNEQVVVQVDSLGTSFPALLEVASGEVHRLPYPSLHGAALSPQADLVLYSGVPPGGRAIEYFVAPVDAPGMVRVVRPSRPGRMFHQTGWWSRSLPGAYLDTLRFQNPFETLVLGTTGRLSVLGRDPEGRAVPIRVPLTWASSDSTILSVDGDGAVHARAPGTATITARIPGWRTARLRITVLGEPARPVLRETWDSTWPSRWTPYGTPAPLVVQGPDGVAGFLNNGDGSFGSGALSQDGWDPRGGLGFEMRLSTPATLTQFQNLTVHLREAPRPDLTMAFDTALGAIETSTPPGFRQECGFAYPGGEGGLSVRQLSLAGEGASILGSLAVGRWIRSGEWWTARVQLFPDGRCGLAVNGVPVWLSRDGLALGGRWRLHLGSSSYQARMLHGPLVLWQGVPSDIDWSGLDTLQGRAIPLAEAPRPR